VNKYGQATFASQIWSTPERRPSFGEYWSAANFFSGYDVFAHPWVYVDYAVTPRSEGPAAASKLYKNWNFAGKQEQSRMFSAIARFRGGPDKHAMVMRALEGFKDYA
jgi:hypothetical protein